MTMEKKIRMIKKNDKNMMIKVAKVMKVTKAIKNSLVKLLYSSPKDICLHGNKWR